MARAGTSHGGLESPPYAGSASMRKGHQCLPVGRAFKPAVRAFLLCVLLGASLGGAAQQKPTPPIASQMTTSKVVIESGKEVLEPSSAAVIGDTIEYTATHRNVSKRRLLEVDFGIPIPFGTTYVEDSAQPQGARRARLDKERDQMVWRVEKLEPGETVAFRLRVLVSPDPSLVPLPAQPRRPELRRP
jgi:uncharacterized repeat protein (TIGR01451 family)